MRCTLFILSLALVWLSSCSPPKRESATSSTVDSWYRPPSDWTRFRQAKALPDADVTQVSPALMASAEGQLRDAAWVKVTPDRASELAGHPMKAQADSSFFLVRAVFLNRGTGKFSVTLVGSELLVEHGSLGHSSAPMKRQALVVRLPQPPEVVFVSCSMAE
jgi:hypothetical protein